MNNGTVMFAGTIAETPLGDMEVDYSAEGLLFALHSDKKYELTSLTDPEDWHMIVFHPTKMKFTLHRQPLLLNKHSRKRMGLDTNTVIQRRCGK